MKHTSLFLTFGTFLLATLPQKAFAQCGPAEVACGEAAWWALSHPRQIIGGGTAIINQGITQYQRYQSQPPVQYQYYTPQYRYPQSTPYVAVPQYQIRAPQYNFPQYRRR